MNNKIKTNLKYIKLFINDIKIKAIIIAFLQYMASAFIGAGWPLLFEPPILTCYSSNDD